MSLHDDVKLGDEAKHLLDNKVFQKAFDDVETAIHNRWASAPVADAAGCHQLKLMLKLLGDLRANLEQAIADGKLAAEELRITEQRKSPMQKLRSLIR